MPGKDFKTAHCTNCHRYARIPSGDSMRGTSDQCHGSQGISKQVYDDTPALRLLWLHMTHITVGNFVESWKSLQG